MTCKALQRLKHISTPITLFSIGFVAVSIQFIFMRQVSPFVGTSTITASIVVSIFLAALAGGVARGGRKGGAHLKTLSNNLIISAAFLGIGGSYIATSSFFSGYYYVLEVISQSFVYTLLGPIIASPFFALSLYLFIFMYPLVFLIEQSVPLLMNFINGERASKIAGDAFNKSTWGNVLGGAFTTLFCMYYLGLGLTIAVNTIILVIIALSVPGHRSMSKVVLGSSILLITFTLNVSFERLSFKKTTAYSNYAVFDSERGRHLVTNNNFSSVIGKDGKTYEYMEIIKKEIDVKGIGNRDILVLGAGGFTFTHDGTGENNVVYVDIDPSVKEVAETHFLEDEIKGKFIAADARSYLVHNSKTWDIIVIDAYTGMNSIPQSLLTVEFHELVHQRLRQNGRAYYNFIVNPDMSDEYSKGVDSTVRTAFRGCHSHPVDLNSNITNVVYVCFGKAEASPLVYSDEFNKHEFHALGLTVSTMKSRNNRYYK